MTDDIAVARRVLTAEAEALGILAAALDSNLVSAVDTCFRASGRIVCVGVGKSGHVARKIAATLASTGSPSQFVHPTEASHGDLGMITKDDVVLALSRSGETPELSDVLHYAKRFSIPLIGMTAKASSALGQAADNLLLVPDIAEACPVTRAPTTSTTLMMALGDALAVALLERRGFKEADFSTFHPGGKLGAMLKKVGDIMRTNDAVPLVRQGTAFDVAIDVLSDMRLGCVGVLDANDKLIGILTDGDIRRLVREGKRFDIVDEAMTRDPITVTSPVLAHSAISLMSERNITQLFVVNDTGHCDGVLHMHDVLKAGVV
ncbi:MAG: KpsF/GutQ family sugar-phosphate isomerase [Pseudomonadota bacterium]